MRSHGLYVVITLAACIITAAVAAHFGSAQETPSQRPEKLAVVWTSGDPEVAHRMTLMYVHASQKQGWFDENLLIVWGPSARLLAADKDLQAKIEAMIDDGVQVKACIVCADSYGVSDDLRQLGIEVKPMGAPLTRLVQSDQWDVMTY